MLIDTHAHLNFSDFDKDRDEVIKKCLKSNVFMINVGVDYETSKKAIEIAEKYERGVYAAIGLHPINLDKENFDILKYEDLYRSSKKVVAIGEVGLDYLNLPSLPPSPMLRRTSPQELRRTKQNQKNLLLEELNLAKKLNLPVIFHCRMAHNDLIEILQKSRGNSGLPQTSISELRGVVHCFTGNAEQTKQYLDMGFYLGFNGIIFKKIKGIDFDEIIKKTPLDRILIETDCPYLCPPQCENQRNEPINVKYVVEKITEIKNMSFEKIADITFENAKNLFRI